MAEMIIRRISVRIVAKISDKYLVLSTKRGDIIFPGGGIELGETHEVAASRELLEETGYKSNGEMKYLGRFITQRFDRFDDSSIYETEMFFYLCGVHDEPFKTSHSENEVNLKIKPLWLKKSEILKINKKYNDTLGELDVWTKMTEFVLDYIEK
jgi:8-oxo-dGTP pyrophosphatase MutT (NUDIX family)